MSTTHDLGSKAVPLQITEDEAAVYDRQIRLWGIEAQQRMRNATILVFQLKGTATETIKNLVLAGIGKLIVVDGENVAEEDLGAGFFFRDDDVGKKRVDAAKARIQSLNPLVAVETLPGLESFDDQQLSPLIQSVDLVCMTDWNRDDLVLVNGICRRLSKPLYAGGTFGLLGYIFCDLVHHEYVFTEKTGSTEAPPRKVSVAYPSLTEALGFKWSVWRQRDTKKLKPDVAFSIYALWEYQSVFKGQLPDSSVAAPELQKISNRLMAELGVNAPSISSETIQSLTETSAHELSPVCAVVGGLLAQDILKALAAREPPLANFLTFDGIVGGATILRLAMP